VRLLRSPAAGGGLRVGAPAPRTRPALLQPFPAERMEAYRVGYDVGAPANDRPDLLASLS